MLFSHHQHQSSKSLISCGSSLSSGLLVGAPPLPVCASTSRNTLSATSCLSCFHISSLRVLSVQHSTHKHKSSPTLSHSYKVIAITICCAVSHSLLSSICLCLVVCWSVYMLFIKLLGFSSNKIVSVTNDSSWNWYRSKGKKFSSSTKGTYASPSTHAVNSFPQVSDTPTDTPPLPESQSRGSLSPLRVVRDPRKKANNEGDEGHDPVSEDSSMVSLV